MWGSVGNSWFGAVPIMWIISTASSQLCSNSACIPENYSKMDLPRPKDGGPVVVDTTMGDSMSNVREKIEGSNFSVFKS